MINIVRWIMDNKEELYHPKLGYLTYREGPQAIHCWSGIIEGCENEFTIILDNSDIETADIDFIANIIEKWQHYEKLALNFIKLKLHSEPELLKTTYEETVKYISEENLPATSPQFLFYQNFEWIIHFMDCLLPIGDSYGIGVVFDGVTATAIEDFSEAEIIDEKEYDFVLDD